MIKVCYVQIFITICESMDKQAFPMLEVVWNGYYYDPWLQTLNTILFSIQISTSCVIPLRFSYSFSALQIPLSDFDRCLKMKCFAWQIAATWVKSQNGKHTFRHGRESTQDFSLQYIYSKLGLNLYWSPNMYLYFISYLFNKMKHM